MTYGLSVTTNLGSHCLGVLGFSEEERRRKGVSYRSGPAFYWTTDTEADHE